MRNQYCTTDGDRSSDLCRAASADEQRFQPRHEAAEVDAAQQPALRALRRLLEPRRKRAACAEDQRLDRSLRELELCREMVVRPLAFEGLRGLAAVAVVEGDAKRAATLAGAADAHRYDKVQDPVEGRLDETFLKPARTRCGTDAWNSAARDGSVLSFEDAIAYALEEPRS